MGETAIAAVAFLAGVLFANAYPLLVRYIDGWAMKATPATSDDRHPSIYQQVTREQMIAINKGIERAPVPTPHRRIGLAELRRRAESESQQVQNHQAEVTAKNAKALETV